MIKFAALNFYMALVFHGYPQLHDINFTESKRSNWGEIEQGGGDREKFQSKAERKRRDSGREKVGGEGGGRDHKRYIC